MKIVLTVSLMASLFAGCALYDQGGADNAGGLCGGMTNNTNEGHGQKDGWNDYEASDCIRRGDAAMANGDELEAITWYKEAVKRGSALGRLKEKVAGHALADATAEPSPASIDYEICRTACTMKCSGRLARVNERLLERYARRPVFSIADAAKLSHEECQRFACELAAIGNDNAIHYLYTRKLIEVNDTKNGGMLHHAAVAGHVRIVDWLVGVCQADPNKVDDRGKSPSDWVNEEMKTCDQTRRKQLQAVLESLKKWMNMKEEQ